MKKFVMTHTMEVAYTEEEYAKGLASGQYTSEEEMAERLTDFLNELFVNEVYEPEENLAENGFYAKELSLTVEPLEDAEVSEV